jgi:hypothetical protein
MRPAGLCLTERGIRGEAMTCPTERAAASQKKASLVPAIAKPAGGEHLRFMAEPKCSLCMPPESRVALDSKGVFVGAVCSLLSNAATDHCLLSAIFEFNSKLRVSVRRFGVLPHRTILCPTEDSRAFCEAKPASRSCRKMRLFS